MTLPASISLAADLHGLMDQVVGVGHLAVEGQSCPGRSASRRAGRRSAALELDVPAGHLQDRRTSGDVGLVEHRRDGGQDRGQRRPQLVAEHGQELVLGPVGLLGLGPCGPCPLQESIRSVSSRLRSVMSVDLPQIAEIEPSAAKSGNLTER